MNYFLESIDVLRMWIDYGIYKFTISSAEDVGRHNALDKAIGKVFMENQISNIKNASCV